MYILFFLIRGFVFSQQTHVKSFSSNATSIEIYTEGLDEIKIINSENNQVEVSLFDENPNSHHIVINQEIAVLKIKFNLNFQENNAVFRKFITKRLHRASVVIKLPKNKVVTILGTNIGVVSKDYKGNLNIYIDKGYINVNRVQQSVDVKLFQGNVFATISKSNINIKSTKGKILVDKKLHLKQYKKVNKNTVKTFSLNSINANVLLTTK